MYAIDNLFTRELCNSVVFIGNEVEVFAWKVSFANTQRHLCVWCLAIHSKWEQKSEKSFF